MRVHGLKPKITVHIKAQGGGEMSMYNNMLAITRVTVVSGRTLGNLAVLVKIKRLINIIAHNDQPGVC